MKSEEEIPKYSKNENLLVETGWSHVRMMLDREMPVATDLTGIYRASTAVVLLLLALVSYFWWPTELDSLAILQPDPQPLAGSSFTHSVAAQHIRKSNSRNFPSRQPIQPNILEQSSGDVVFDQGVPAKEVSSIPRYFAFGSRFVAPFKPMPTLVTTSVISLTPPLAQAPVQSLDNSVTNVSDNKEQRARFSVGLFAGAIAGQVKSLPSLKSGILVRWQPKSANWSLQTGIGYRFQRLSGENRPFVPVDFKSYVTATDSYGSQSLGATNNLTYIASANRVLVPLDKAHYLDFPSQINLQVLRRLQLSGGVTFSRLLRVESANKSLFTYNLNILETPNRKMEELDELVQRQIPAWETSWQTGLGFALGRHWELQVLYSQIWQREPALAKTDQLETCYNCKTLYPEASRRTERSVRPQAIQLSTIYKF
jgi:hypothetical protein